MTPVPESGWRVPGRVEVLGKHTDYAGGNVLVCAVGRGVTARGTRRADRAVVARSSAYADPVTLVPGGGDALPNGHWGRYLQAVVDRFTTVFGPLDGADVVLDSDLPLASGMSSSSALLVAVALTWADAIGLSESEAWADLVGDDRLRLASFLASVENGRGFGPLGEHSGVGTHGGSEDHVAMLCGRRGELVEFGFAPTREHRSVPWPDGWSLVVATSGVAAEKTGAAQALYNRASLATQEILDRWNSATGRDDATLADAVRTSPTAPSELAGLVARNDFLSHRLEQFVVESEVLVPAAVDALAVGDLDAFASAVTESQWLAETHLGNQVPQTSDLVTIAGDLGAKSASSFGAGFGGSVWALVETGAAEGFAGNWLATYRRNFPDDGSRASTLITVPSAPAERLSCGFRDPGSGGL